MIYSLISWIIVAIALAASLISYPDLPEQMAIHWNISNEIDGLANKAFALLLMPALMVILIVVLPKKQNYAQHKQSLLIMQNVILICLLVLHSLTIAYGYGAEVNMIKVVMPMLGILFVASGIYMPRLQPNSYFGIKTNQTLSSESVWKKTHQSSAKFFLLGGLLMIPAGFLPAPFQMISLFAIIVIIVIASAFFVFHFGKDNK